MSHFDVENVRARATQIRCDIITMVGEAGSGHPGGSLSAADIMATLFFGDILTYDPTNPKDPVRDRFFLSKGHAAPVLYAALARAGYFPLDEIKTLRKLKSRLQGHPDSNVLPGVEVSTGSLGQGLSIAAGSALALKQQGGGQKVYALVGDGELQEGQMWEAIMFAAHYNLGNLIVLVDFNNLQIDGSCTDVLSLGDLESKFAAFGWDARSIDGHDPEAIHDAIVEARGLVRLPHAIICRTTKGKGVSYMENVAGWHGKAPDETQTEEALTELLMRDRGQQ